MNATKLRGLALLLCFSFLPLPLSRSAEQQSSTQSLELARQLNEAFVQVAEKVSPTVVVLNVVQKVPDTPADKDEEESWEGLPPGFWRRFHEQFRHGPPEKSLGQGSGVIIRADGYILTNRHVVGDAESIEVRLQDGRRFKATLRGLDPQSDVAVIKIEAQNLPVATLADSTRTRVGEFAIAIGAPFSLDYSVTFGHVSAKSRSNVIEGFEGAAMDQDFIQTDAQINPGNSGGPLVNINGEVIGINTLIRGLHTGIGFAIPSTLAKEVADQLIANGKFVRPWLGIGIQALRDQPELKELIKGVEEGVVVSQIMSDGPAAKSELRPADIITAVDGRPVATPQQLRTALRAKAAGQAVSLDLFRKGKAIQVQVTPGEWKEATPSLAVAKTKSTPTAPAEAPKLGLTVQPLTKDLAAKFGVDGTQGVLVSAVDRKSLASLRGLKAGDVITSVNEQSVSSPREFHDALKKADLRKGVLLNLVSDKSPRFEIIKQE